MKPNHLIHETSPYLLQHAYNPVEWFAWSEQAFKKAKKEDKPILVSIGYAACHWCHVMEHESFENEETAKFMNQFFVNIKVDREERPDVDHIYMNACQLLTGGGGWPLNMFLTPDLKPFTGGTYFPPKPGYGKSSWMEVLVFVHDIFTRERDKVEEQSQSLSDHILKMDDVFIRPLNKNAEELFSIEELDRCIKQIKNQFDTVNGGFGAAPKFPGTMSLNFLLKLNYLRPDEEIERHIQLSLDKMMRGGLYDQAGGGFARYTVDQKWHIPHFEKMLYDNALLVSLFSEAYMITQNESWKQVVEQTLLFLEQEMMHPEFGFFASYDADSEGVEGKFYTWTKQEIEDLFGQDAGFVCRLYDITKEGNWEHTNILHRTISDQQLCDEFQLSEQELKEKINSVNAVLYTMRLHREKPALDDKIILSWNALMCSAYVRAFKAFEKPEYKMVAENCLIFLNERLKTEKSGLSYYHNLTKGVAKNPAILDDYAALIRAFLDVYGITGRVNYLEKAEELTGYVNEHFSDGTMYFFTHQHQSDLPLRNKDFYDNATPSGNSVMFNNLLQLAAYTSNHDYLERAEKMFLMIKETLLQHSTSFGNWLCGGLSFIYPFAEVIVTGKNAGVMADELNHIYHPFLTIQFDETGSREEIVFTNRFEKNKDQIFLCRQGVCRLPVTDVQDFKRLLQSF